MGLSVQGLRGTESSCPCLVGSLPLPESSDVRGLEACPVPLEVVNFLPEAWLPCPRVQVLVCTCVHTHTHTHRDMHAHTHTCRHAHTERQAHIHRCRHACLHIHTCRHAHTHRDMHARAHTHTRADMQAHTPGSYLVTFPSSSPCWERESRDPRPLVTISNRLSPETCSLDSGVGWTGALGNNFASFL